MKTRTRVALVLATCLAPSLTRAAAAQATIAPGQTITGRLEASDPRLDDDSHYDDYVYAGRPGDQIVITLRSTEFDTYLGWGQPGPTASQLTSEGSDDDGAGGTDSQLRVIVGTGARYIVRVNSLAGGATGAYTVSVARGTVTPAPAPRPIAAGQTVSGSLDASDPLMGDGSHYDEYTFTGRPGEQVVITLRSAAFDSYLAWGHGTGPAFASEATDDDGAGGNDAQLRVMVGGDGTYTIRANSLAPGATGAYTLNVLPAGN